MMMTDVSMSAARHNVHTIKEHQIGPVTYLPPRSKAPSSHHAMVAKIRPWMFAGLDPALIAQFFSYLYNA